MKEKNTLLKMVIYSEGSPPKRTLSSPVYWQYQRKNVSKKTFFHKQNIPDSHQKQSTDPSNRDTSKDHHTNFIPIQTLWKKEITVLYVNSKEDEIKE